MRKPIVLFLIILFLFSLAACTQQTQPTTTQPAQQKTYVGSVNSDKYHYPSCQWAKKIKPENEIWFSSASDAKDAGYVSCNVCKPPYN